MARNEILTVAKKAADTWRGTDTYHQAAQIIDMLVDELEQPTLTPPNEWVSVENVLPPEHEPVLCIVSGKPKANITLEEAYQLGSWNKADGWIIDEYSEWEDADVSWWRKLPEPPDSRQPEGGDADHA